jgi:Phage major tail protein 2.
MPPTLTPVTIPLGSDAKMYIDAVEVNTATDITLNLEKGEANVTTRGSKGWEEFLPTNKSASIDATLVWDTADESFTKIMRAYLFGTPLDCMFLDGEYVADSKGTGLNAWCGVFGFTREETLQNALTAKTKFKPTYAGSNEEMKPRWLVNGREEVATETGGGG